MKKNSGFTLIELMAVVVIIGVMSSFAAFTYRDHIIEANRTEGRSALHSAAATLEKCRSIFGRYDHDDCNYDDFSTESNLYSITAAVAATAFTLTASPVAGSVQTNDLDCADLTLNNLGIREATGSATEDCW